MSTGFTAVQWNRDKIIYDAVLVVGVAVFIAGFVGISASLRPPADRLAWIDVWIRACGACAFTMLTIILCIGPLARLDRRFLKLLYNRRHFGVLTCLVAIAHVACMLAWFAAQNALPSLLSELTNTADYRKFIGFPFKALGIAALLILVLLAATSHDYWMAFLTPRVWKRLHMALYVAYGLVLMHVALGVMQFDRHPAQPFVFGGAFVLVAGLHIAAGWREAQAKTALHDGWITVGPPASIPDKAATVVTAPDDERIAVFRDGTRVGALTNVCAHQQGPLGEARIIDGCITCPWHGWQYRLEDGCAPPPFTEKVTTFRVRLRDGIVEVDPTPLPRGTPVGITVSL